MCKLKYSILYICIYYICTMYSSVTVNCSHTHVEYEYRSRIHERTISLRFMGILGVLRLKVSVYNAYITHQFETTFARGWGGGRGVKCRGDCEQQGGKLVKLLSQLRPRIRPLVCNEMQCIRHAHICLVQT
jgi:hypothetical protein